MHIIRKTRVTFETRRIVITAHAVRNAPDCHSEDGVLPRALPLAQPAAVRVPAVGVPRRGRIYHALRAKFLGCLAGLRGWFPFL